jgi:biotin carboxylase
VTSFDELQTAYDQFEKPVILKAVDTSGSRGIIRVDAAKDLVYAYEYVRKATRQEYFLIEEFISGVEFGAQAAVIDGELQFVMPHGDILYHGKTDVPIGHYVPYELTSKVEEMIQTQLEKSIRALGLKTCAINADFILHDDQVYVLEIGARAGATCLPELVSTHYEIDYYAYILNMSLGISPAVQFTPKDPCGNLLITSDQGGVLDRIDVDGNDLDLIEVVKDYDHGARIPAFRLGPDRLGHVVLKASDNRKLLGDLEKLESKIHVGLIAD